MTAACIGLSKYKQNLLEFFLCIYLVGYKEVANPLVAKVEHLLVNSFSIRLLKHKLYWQILRNQEIYH